MIQPCATSAAASLVWQRRVGKFLPRLLSLFRCPDGRHLVGDGDGDNPFLERRRDPGGGHQHEAPDFQAACQHRKVDACGRQFEAGAMASAGKAHRRLHFDCAVSSQPRAADGVGERHRFEPALAQREQRAKLLLGGSDHGSNVTENSGDAHCFKYNFTTNYVCGLEVVLTDNNVIQIGNVQMKVQV